MIKNKLYNLKGKIFHRLKVIRYSRSKSSGRFWLCRCSCGKMIEIRATNLITNRTKSCGCLRSFKRENNKSHMWKGYGEIGNTYFWCLRRSALLRKIKFQLSLEYIWNLFIQQKRKCSLSGLDLKFHTSTRVRDGNASLDRIDSNKGYVKGNVQWVHKDINFMKQSLTDNDLIRYCGLIWNNRR